MKQETEQNISILEKQFICQKCWISSNLTRGTGRQCLHFLFPERVISQKILDAQNFGLLFLSTNCTYSAPFWYFYHCICMFSNISELKLYDPQWNKQSKSFKSTHWQEATAALIFKESVCQFSSADVWLLNY